MEEKVLIQWFPGHMAKAQRMIRENLKLVDVVVELLDARIPNSSANPAIHEIVAGKPRLVALNKADLADEKLTREWLKAFSREGLRAVAVDSITGRGMKTLLKEIEILAREKTNRFAEKGANPRAPRAMILGIPNVGKSSLINRLIGSSVAKTADKPGVTRTKQWLKVGKSLELLDTPGVLWPKFEDAEVGLKLAFTGAINDEVYDMERTMEVFLQVMRNCYADRLIERYKLKEALPESSEKMLEMIGAKRGCLRSGGVVDVETARRIILNEFRGGKLGTVTLDIPPDVSSE